MTAGALGLSFYAAWHPHQQGGPHAYHPATQRQAQADSEALNYLRDLAMQTGTSFVYPYTFGKAKSEIRRLIALKGQQRAALRRQPYLSAALERLRELGYLENFGPIAYQLSVRGIYSLAWDERLPARMTHPRDYDPPPRKNVLDDTAEN